MDAESNATEELGASTRVTRPTNSVHRTDRTIAHLRRFNACAYRVHSGA